MKEELEAQSGVGQKETEEEETDLRALTIGGRGEEGGVGLGWGPAVSRKVVRQQGWQGAWGMRSGLLDGLGLGQEWLWRKQCGEGRPRGNSRAPRN